MGSWNSVCMCLVCTYYMSSFLFQVELLCGLWTSVYLSLFLSLYMHIKDLTPKLMDRMLL